jgi:hypothetical protein
MAVVHIDRRDAHDIDRHRFDARVAAWEKNEVRERSIMSSVAAAAAAAALPLPLATLYRSDASRPATNEPTPTPHHHHPYQLHHAAVHVWHPSRRMFSAISLHAASVLRAHFPSHFFKGTPVDPRYPFLEILPLRPHTSSRSRVRNLDRT